MKTLVHVDNEQIESVLKQCSICFVGMADTDGTPYVIPMNFGCTKTVRFICIRLRKAEAFRS